MSSIGTPVQDGPPQELEMAEGATGGVGKADCDITGGALDAIRTALMNSWAAHMAPLGLKVMTSVNSILNLFCGALQTVQGVSFLWLSVKTDWLFGKLFGFTRVGCGLTLFTGGAITLIQHIGEVMLVLGIASVKVAALTSLVAITTAIAPYAYMAMFVFLIGMCFVFLHKAGAFQARLDKTPEEFKNPFITKKNTEESLKSYLSNPYPSLLPDAPLEERILSLQKQLDPEEPHLDEINEWLHAKQTIDELKMFLREETITTLETNQSIEASRTAIQTDLTEKKRFWTILLVASCCMITVMALGLILTGPIAATVLFGIGIALSLVFAYGNIKNMQMALRDAKGTTRELLPIYIITGLITAITLVALWVNPTAWLTITVIGTLLLLIQLYLVYRLLSKHQTTPSMPSAPKEAAIA